MRIDHHVRASGLLAFALCMLVPLSSARAQGMPDLVGAWREKDSSSPMTLVLNADGTGKLDEDSIKYTVRGDRIVVDQGGDANTYTFRLSGDTLTDSGGDLDQPVAFVRQSGAPAKGIGARRAQPAPAATRPAGGGLVGRWQGDSATVQVNEDGTLVYNGETLRYAVQGNVITIMTDEGPLRVQFQVDGDTLVTNFNGQRTTYKRIAAGGGRDASGGGANPAELIGKWCYMSNVSGSGGGRMSNRCFTLYENGTYEYYGETSSSGPVASSASQESDSGTWSATATTITANSRANGRQTYSLEKRNHPKTGDPMLVIDGDAYVTYHQRPPWP